MGDPWMRGFLSDSTVRLAFTVYGSLSLWDFHGLHVAAGLLLCCAQPVSDELSSSLYESNIVATKRFWTMPCDGRRGPILARCVCIYTYI